MTSERNRKSVDELTARNVETIAEMERASQSERTAGQRVADAFAGLVGSWTFIIIQSVLLALWVTINALSAFKAIHWDEYPFVFLNLALSFQAAYAAPIIMMSQNRQARMAERRNHLDLQINLLAEQESTEMLRMLRRICEQLKISVGDEPNIQALEQRTRPDQVVQQIKQSVEAADKARQEGGKERPSEQAGRTGE